jgi:hypothetical protein
MTPEQIIGFTCFIQTLFEYPARAVYIPTYTVAVAQLVEALRYKPEGRGFDSRRRHWNFSLT